MSFSFSSVGAIIPKLTPSFTYSYLRLSQEKNHYDNARATNTNNTIDVYNVFMHYHSDLLHYLYMSHKQCNDIYSKSKRFLDFFTPHRKHTRHPSLLSDHLLSRD